MLLYSLLHLTGYDLSLEDIKSFRQWGSRTPGHPESHLTPGVEATTGPLGQGISNAVGMAIAEAHLAARFNRPGHAIVDHHTYVLASDGDLMEGVASEACSLAGHLGLGKLIVLYDDNRISARGIDVAVLHARTWARGSRPTAGTSSASTDGNDLDGVDRALDERAERGAPAVADHRADRDRLRRARTRRARSRRTARRSAPTRCRRGQGDARLAGGAAVSTFRTPRSRNFRRARRARARRHIGAGSSALEAYGRAFPELAAELRATPARRAAGGLGRAICRRFAADAKGLATRKASEAVMQALAERCPS